MNSWLHVFQKWLKIWKVKTLGDFTVSRLTPPLNSLFIMQLISAILMALVSFICLYIFAIWLFRKSHKKHDYWCHTDNILPEHAHGHTEPHV